MGRWDNKNTPTRMLIHELIQQKAKNWHHTYPSDFFAAIYTKDELSEFIEKGLFIK